MTKQTEKNKLRFPIYFYDGWKNNTIRLIYSGCNPSYIETIYLYTDIDSNVYELTAWEVINGRYEEWDNSHLIN